MLTTGVVRKHCTRRSWAERLCDVFAGSEGVRRSDASYASSVGKRCAGHPSRLSRHKGSALCLFLLVTTRCQRCIGSAISRKRATPYRTAQRSLSLIPRTATRAWLSSIWDYAHAIMLGSKVRRDRHPTQWAVSCDPCGFASRSISILLFVERVCRAVPHAA
jgi:hypothetical protein